LRNRNDAVSKKYNGIGKKVSAEKLSILVLTLQVTILLYSLSLSQFDYTKLSRSFLLRKKNKMKNCYKFLETFLPKEKKVKKPETFQN